MNTWTYYRLTALSALVSDEGITMRAVDGTTLRFESIVEAQEYLLTAEVHGSLRWD